MNKKNENDKLLQTFLFQFKTKLKMRQKMKILNVPFIHIIKQKK